MALLLFSMPFLTLAQPTVTGDAAQAIIDAQTDVKKDHNTDLNVAFTAFLVSAVFGCIGGSVVVATSQITTPTPPADRFIGKSTEYIVFYTQTYEKERKNQRGQAAFGGCIGGSIVAGVFWSNYYKKHGSSF